MAVLLTLLLGFIGGTIAYLCHIPTPWLIGSLIILFVGQKLPFIESPNKVFFRWMRVILGVTVGATAASDISHYSSLLPVTAITALIFVLFLTFVGFLFFNRLPSFKPIDNFISALPGGLTFILSISDNLSENYPKVALIHTVRIFVLVLCFTLFGYFVGTDPSEHVLWDAFEFHWSIDLWQLVVLVLACGIFADKFKVSGGHIIFPIIITGFIYHYGVMDLHMPELLKTIAMIAFGVQIGYKLIGGSLKEYKMQAQASFSFTVFAMGIAMSMALFLSHFHDVHYFLIFLALAPGSLPEISLIAIALGFDVGFVAVVHTCRYLFIMLLGWLGIKYFSNPDFMKSVLARFSKSP